VPRDSLVWDSLAQFDGVPPSSGPPHLVHPALPVSIWAVDRRPSIAFAMACAPEDPLSVVEATPSAVVLGLHPRLYPPLHVLRKPRTLSAGPHARPFSRARAPEDASRA